jgi:hypothetical protein
MDIFLIQNLDEILQMDDKTKKKIKMLVGLYLCRTYTLGSKFWK